MRNCAIFFLCLAYACVGQAPTPGRQQYETSCARCHGGDATGGESGPSILAQIASRTEADLTAFLRTGRPAAGMPAFNLGDPQMTALVAYLRTLNAAPRNQSPAVARKRVQTANGALEGRVLNEGMI